MTFFGKITVLTGGLVCLLSLLQPAHGAAVEQNSSLEADLALVKGEVGIAVLDTSRQKEYRLSQDKPFPMQSVCKLPLSIAVLRLADAGKLTVKDKITVRRSDLVALHSPIKDSIRGKQSDFTIANLITRAVCDSDNTACDVLIRRVGGPAAVTAILKEAGIEGVRIDRPE